MTQHAEDNYQKHRDNPGPSKEAIDDQNDERAGKRIKWVIFIAILIMVIAFYFIFKNSQHSF